MNYYTEPDSYMRDKIKVVLNLSHSATDTNFKIMIEILADVFLLNSKYLKIVADTLVTKCDEIVIFMNNLTTKKTSIIATNFTSTGIVKKRKVAIFHIKFC